MVSHTATAHHLPWRTGLAYGALAAPLAFASLPLYVNLPYHYASVAGAPLAGLGAVLLATRAFDALLDPAIGRWVDRLLRQSVVCTASAAILASLLMALGFGALWHPPFDAQNTTGLLGWLACSLLVCTLAYSVLVILHQASGTRWGGEPAWRARVTAWREGASLTGVLLASMLPAWLGLDVTTGFLALGLPLWVKAVARWGLAPSWRAGMLASVLAFGFTPWLGEGDGMAFAVICLASGLALGADLALPGALLTGVIHESGEGGRSEGRYLGWWTCATKLNLALAAGLALPLLSAAGYRSGASEPAGLQALAWAYGGLPCLLKLAAATLLWRAERLHSSWRHI